MGHTSKIASERWSPLAALALLSVIWGYNWVVMKKALVYIGPFDFNALRTALGGFVLLFFMRCQGLSIRPKAVPMTILLGLCQTSAGMGLIIWALVGGGAGKTSILVYTMPFWVMILAWPILSEKIRGVNWIPVIAAFVGMVLILEPWSLKSTIFSEVLAVGAGVCWAVSTIIIKVMQKRPDFDLVSMTAWQFIYGSVPLIAVALLVPQPSTQWTAYMIFAFLYNVLLSCAFAYLLWAFIVKRLPAGVAGMGALTAPVIGITASLIELGEHSDIFETLGMALVLTALSVLTTLRYRENSRKEATPRTPPS